MKKRNKLSRETLALRKPFTRQFYRKNRLMFFLTALAAVLFAFSGLLIPWLMQQILDVASGAAARFTLPQLVLITAALVGVIGLTHLLNVYCHPRFVARAIRQYKDYAFGEIAKKSINSFLGENTSTYLSALSNDTMSIETNYLEKIFTLVEELMLFFGAFALMFFYSPLLTLVGFGLSLFPVIASLLAGNRLARQEKQVSDRNESFLATVKDMLTGFSVVKSFKAEREIVRLFAQANGMAQDAKCRRRRTEIAIHATGIVAGLIAQMGVFLFGSYLALSGRGVTVGIVLAFVQMMNYVVNPISDVPQILANRKAANALIDKLAAALHGNVRREGKPIGKKLEDAIELKDLSFAYEKEKPVLKHVSFRFEAGKSYAVVGGSGSGKSTLLNLLMGSRGDYRGQILYDGNELRSVSTDSLYDLVSIVQQNVFVFNSSIRDNITMFRDFAKEDLERAVRMSGLSGFIRERGAGYQCGENGGGLSGGERQRVSIARCLLRGTPVLLVDEATASLDAATAFSVTNSILDISGLTRVIVTHRLEEALLRKYDRILVLRNGEAEETGTFDELMAKKAYFYSLFTVSQ